MSDLIERLRGPSPSIPAMRAAADEIERRHGIGGELIMARRERDAIRLEAALWEQKYRAEMARIDGAPHAYMDTRVALGLCAPTEADFPALYALQGKRVALVVLDKTNTEATK